METGEICILAGGLSARMGRDKARVRLRGKTLLRHVQDVAGQTGWPVRVIRRDLAPRCGPLGGIYTALKTTSADRVLFLACDMPFISVALLDKLIAMRMPRSGAIFTRARRGGEVGFPFILCQPVLLKVEQQLAARRLSLQSLAEYCRAKTFSPRGVGPALMNLNAPADLEMARKRKQAA